MMRVRQPRDLPSTPHPMQISFGPTIRGAHSPDEAVLVTTVPPFYQLTLTVLAKLVSNSCT
jgi:di/tripeptidase